MQPIQFFAARAEDGVLLPGATVDVFVSGTQTRAALFNDANASVPLDNPTSADNGARVFFFTTAARIDIQIRYGGYLAPLLREVSTVDPADVVNAEVERLRLEVTDGRIYPTKEAGLASGTVANGAFFWATGADASILRTLWFKVDAVTAQHIADELIAGPAGTHLVAVGLPESCTIPVELAIDQRVAFAGQGGRVVAVDQREFRRHRQRPHLRPGGSRSRDTPRA